MDLHKVSYMLNNLDDDNESIYIKLYNPRTWLYYELLF